MAENDEFLEHWKPLEDEIHDRSIVEDNHGSQERFSQRELSALQRCLRRMLVVDPANRATSQDLIEEEWFVNE